MKPTSFILDLLRTYDSRGTSARNLMTSGEMFAFNENLIRVTLSRLVTRGLVENVARGHYRLAKRSDPVNDFVEEWRDGEARCRNWQENSFLMIHLDRTHQKDIWLVSAFGFIALRKGLWLRPDNLSKPFDELHKQFTLLGLNDNAVIGQGMRLSAADSKQLLAHYDAISLQRNYAEVTRKLTKSMANLTALPKSRAMKESFSYGGKAIQLLAKDPLLPREILDPTGRRELWQTMLEYDRAGREIWADQPNVMPTPTTDYQSVS